MTYRDCYEWGRKMLEGAKIPEFSLDARLLLEHICETNRNDLLVHGGREVSAGQLAMYEEAIGKRVRRIPLQHITGQQDFMGLTFEVNEHVLIPRQDTEVLVEARAWGWAEGPGFPLPWGMRVEASASVFQAACLWRPRSCSWKGMGSAETVGSGGRKGKARPAQCRPCPRSSASRRP